MWFILLFAASGLAIQVAFETKKTGRDNILTRSGEEIRQSNLMSHFQRLTGKVSDGVLATVSLLGGFLTLGAAWKVFRLVVHFL